MPTIKEMLEYLMGHNFTQDQEITIMVGDPEKRLVWHPTKLIGITDQNRPITTEDLIDGKYLLAQKGKKNYYLLIVK